MQGRLGKPSIKSSTIDVSVAAVFCFIVVFFCLFSFPNRQLILLAFFFPERTGSEEAEDDMYFGCFLWFEGDDSFEMKGFAFSFVLHKRLSGSSAQESVGRR